jgi:hypothetical protein
MNGPNATGVKIPLRGPTDFIPLFIRFISKRVVNTFGFGYNAIPGAFAGVSGSDDLTVILPSTFLSFQVASTEASSCDGTSSLWAWPVCVISLKEAHSGQ